MATRARSEGTLQVTADPAANRLLNTDPLALLIGMLLDQQVPLEWAFMGPANLEARLGHLDADRTRRSTPMRSSRSSVPSPRCTGTRP